MKFVIALRMALLGMTASSHIPAPGSERAKRAVDNVNVNVHVNGQSLDNTIDEGSSGCTDKGSQCPKLAADGQCTSNPTWMSAKCAKSCNSCGPDRDNGKVCIDKSRQCPYWAAIGQCTKNSKYMRAECAKSCNSCGPDRHTGGGTGASFPGCRDKVRQCPILAADGQCTSNPTWMRAACAKSCNSCGPDREAGCTGEGEVCTRGKSNRGDCCGECLHCHHDCELDKTCAEGTKGTCVRYGDSKCSPDRRGDIEYEGEEDESGCTDKLRQCPKWAAHGQCTTNSKYMRAHCAKSCNSCGPDKDNGGGEIEYGTVDESGCTDKLRQCPKWAAHGKCTTNPDMRAACAKSCNSCGPDRGMDSDGDECAECELKVFQALRKCVKPEGWETDGKTLTDGEKAGIIDCIQELIAAGTTCWKCVCKALQEISIHCPVKGVPY